MHEITNTLNTPHLLGFYAHQTSPNLPKLVPMPSSPLELTTVIRSRLRPPSLRSWLCGATKESNGFVVNHRKHCGLDAASTPTTS
jgi:hypothetical protein